MSVTSPRPGHGDTLVPMITSTSTKQNHVESVCKEKGGLVPYLLLCPQCPDRCSATSDDEGKERGVGRVWGVKGMTERIWGVRDCWKMERGEGCTILGVHGKPLACAV